MTTQGVTTVRSEGLARDAPPSAVEVGSEIGRYVVLGEVGRGGMGVVLRAYDPELEREVALKILQTRGGEEHGDYRAAVLTEARALAKLRHDNVVGVYDVGEQGEWIWIAMEFVRGTSLRSWADDGDRSSAALRRVLAEAGTGLMAAHDAGIVHCDVKPDNIVVADHAYVIDFGLAHGIGTREGSVGAPDGTRPYLAPELYDGAAANVATDVYAFCVTAWELLVGARPWSSSDEQALLQEKRKGPTLPAGRGVSRRLLSVLREGLSPEATARPTSLAPVVAALYETPKTARRLVIGAAIATLAVGWGLSQDPDCEPPLDVAPFDGSGAPAIRRALEMQSSSDAELRWAVIASNLDGFRDQYVRQYRDACEATLVRREQSTVDFDAQRGCLDRRRAQLAVLVSELGIADPKTLREAPRSIARLSGALDCRKPDDAKAAVFQEKLDRVEVLELLSRFDEAETLALSIASEASGAGDRASELWARYRRGRLLHLRGDAMDAAELLSEVHWQAEEADLPGLASTAGLYVLWLHAAVFDDAPTALDWAPHVGAAVRRAGDDVLERATLIESIGIAKLYGNRVPEAYDDFATALELRESAPGDVELPIVSSLGNLGIALEELGRYEEAISFQQRALEILERRLGPTHPHTARAVDNLGTARMRNGELDEALVLFERALGARRAAFGDEHRSTALSWLHIGLARLQAGETTGALEAFGTARPIIESLDAPGGLRATCLEGLAHAHAALEQWDDARTHARAALDSLPASMPDTHPERKALQALLDRSEGP